MKKIKSFITPDQWLLFRILFLLALLSFLFEFWVADMSLYTVVALKGISLFFDGGIVLVYRRFRRFILLKAKGHTWPYYVRETTPFLLVFGFAYAAKIALISVLSIFLPGLTLSPSTIKIAFWGMIVTTLMFSWRFRGLLRKVYKMAREEKEKERKKKEL